MTRRLDVRRGPPPVNARRTPVSSSQDARQSVPRPSGQWTRRTTARHGPRRKNVQETLPLCKSAAQTPAACSGSSHRRPAEPSALPPTSLTAHHAKQSPRWSNPEAFPSTPQPRSTPRRTLSRSSCVAAPSTASRGATIRAFWKVLWLVYFTHRASASASPGGRRSSAWTLLFETSPSSRRLACIMTKTGATGRCGLFGAGWESSEVSQTPSSQSRRRGLPWLQCRRHSTGGIRTRRR
mmetsp:Transcript_22044/g.76361  ORF Transcript_22044/g.76361 Transcript_22044/m.76361 type:complete len:238 (-) Transcript_22044:963-1676(-)